MATYIVVVGEALLLPNQTDPDSETAPYEVTEGGGGAALLIDRRGVPRDGAMRILFDTKIESGDTIGALDVSLILPQHVQDLLSEKVDTTQSPASQSAAVVALFSEWWPYFTTNVPTVSNGVITDPVFGPVKFPGGVTKNLWVVRIQYKPSAGGSFPDPLTWTSVCDWMHSLVN